MAQFGSNLALRWPAYRSPRSVRRLNRSAC